MKVLISDQLPNALLKIKASLENATEWIFNNEQRDQPNHIQL